MVPTAVKLGVPRLESLMGTVHTGCGAHPLCLPVRSEGRIAAAEANARTSPETEVMNAWDFHIHLSPEWLFQYSNWLDDRGSIPGMGQETFLYVTISTPALGPTQLYNISPRN
jgi:hypothetical protein